MAKRTTKEKEDAIIKAYVEDKLNVRKLAEKFGYKSTCHVRCILKRNNIKPRNKCESLMLCPEEFTNEELEVLVGSLLGDGAITTKRGPQGECQFYEGHCIEQLPYLEWKYEKLKRFIGAKIYPLNHKMLTGNICTTYNLITRKSPLFTDLRRKFYIEDSKESPKKLDKELISKYLTPLSFYVWCMDDGSRSSKNKFHIYSQSFTKKDNEFLQVQIKNKFDIEIEIKPFINGTGFILAISNEYDIATLKDICKNYLHPVFKYKLY